MKLILADVERLESQQDWNQALVAAKRAESALASGDVDTATQLRVQRVLADLTLVGRLEEARLALEIPERDRAIHVSSRAWA